MNNPTYPFGTFAVQLEDPELIRAYLESPRQPIFDLLIGGEITTDDGMAHGHGCACCELVAAR